MSSITIRNLDPTIKERLRVRAAERGHSREAEARRILTDALGTGGTDDRPGHAATALVAGAAVATRDVEGLKDYGLTIINPWDATGQTD
jgi:plasmid stability protein